MFQSTSSALNLVSEGDRVEGGRDASGERTLIRLYVFRLSCISALRAIRIDR
jgi:hypothetical protein